MPVSLESISSDASRKGKKEKVFCNGTMGHDQVQKCIEFTSMKCHVVCCQQILVVWKLLLICFTQSKDCGLTGPGVHYL